MHELSIAQNIIDIVENQLSDQQLQAVKIVRVKVGKLTNILVDSLIFGFDVLIKESSLKDAVLEVEHLPISIECEECGQQSEVDSYAFSCPKCNSPGINIISGNELSVSEIELND